MDTKICENLLNTYNTNILDLEDKKIKEAFLNVSLKYHNGKKGKKVLMKLICNHFNTKIKKPTPVFIGGPQNLTVHWSEEYQKLIYIFGEYYSDVIDCYRFKDDIKGEILDKPGAKKMSIEYFLEELLRSPDVFLDIFFEFPAMNKGEKSYNDNFNPFSGINSNIRLKNLFKKFKNCVQYSTRSDQKCHLSRIHYFDTRFYDNNGVLEGVNTISSFRLKVYNIITTAHDTEWSFKFKELLKNNQEFVVMLKNLNNVKNEEILDFFMTQTRNKYVEKELSKIDENIYNAIIRFAEDEMKERIVMYKRLWQKNVPIILNSKSSNKIFVSCFMEIFNSTLHINSLVANMYLLSRVFKKFNTKENIYIDQPSEAHNIIIYAGDKHSELCRKFLNQNLGFKEVSNSGIKEKIFGDNMHCLNMKTIQQPLFSKWLPTKKGFFSSISEYFFK